MFQRIEKAFDMFIGNRREEEAGCEEKERGRSSVKVPSSTISKLNHARLMLKRNPK